MKSINEVEKLMLDLSSEEEREEFREQKILELMEKFDKLYDSIEEKFKEKFENNNIEYAEAFKILITETDKKVKSYLSLLENGVNKKVSKIENYISTLEEQMVNSDVNVRKAIREQIKDAKKEIKEITDESSTKQKELMNDILNTIEESSKIARNSDLKFKDVFKTLEEYRSEFNQRIETVIGRGGSMNRQILVAGSNPLTRYTDYNIIAGNNVTITTANNDSKRRVDITFTATGTGGGSGFQAPVSGSLGQNTFVWATAPNVITIDHIEYQKVSTDGTVNWTGTTTTVLSITPLSDIFSPA